MGHIIVALFLGISIVAAVPFAWYFLRGDGADAAAKFSRPQARRPAKRAVPKTKAPQKVARRNFKGATVQPGENCCQAVREFSKTRFLVEEAPRLPLERCDRIAECACKYHNHPDRRSGEDRRHVFGSLSTAGKIGSADANHRTGMDRRSSVDAELENIDFEL